MAPQMNSKRKGSISQGMLHLAPDKPAAHQQDLRVHLRQHRAAAKGAAAGKRRDKLRTRRLQALPRCVELKLLECDAGIERQSALVDGRPSRRVALHRQDWETISLGVLQLSAA